MQPETPPADTCDGPLLVSQREAAARLGVSPTTVRKMIRLHQLPVVVVGSRVAIRRVDLDRFISGLRG